METVREHNFLRMAFTLEHWATDDDYKTMSGYHPMTIMEKISDNYCDLDTYSRVARTTYWQEFMLR
jgi:hypothetical protein